MKVRLRAFILDPMTVGSYKVVQNDRMSKLRRVLVLLVLNVSVTKVVRQAWFYVIRWTEAKRPDGKIRLFF